MKYCKHSGMYCCAHPDIISSCSGIRHLHCQLLNRPCTNTRRSYIVVVHIPFHCKILHTRPMQGHSFFEPPFPQSSLRFDPIDFTYKNTATNLLMAKPTCSVLYCLWSDCISPDCFWETTEINMDHRSVCPHIFTHFSTSADSFG